MNDKAIKKRDARVVKIKMGGGLSGTLAVFIDASVDTTSEGLAQLRYTVGAGALANASEGAAAVSLNDRILEEEARLVQRVESHVGPTQERPAELASSQVVDNVITPTSSGGDLVSQIAKMADLHAQGMLTAEEFAAAKARLLG